MKGLFRRIRPAGRDAPPAPGPRRAGEDGARHLLHLLGEGGAPDATPPPEDELRRIAAELVRRIEGGQAAPRRAEGATAGPLAPRASKSEATSALRAEASGPGADARTAGSGTAPESAPALDPGAGWRAAMRAAPKGRGASAPAAGETATPAQPREEDRARAEPRVARTDPTAARPGWMRSSTGSGSTSAAAPEADDAGPVFRSRLARHAEAPGAPRADGTVPAAPDAPPAAAATVATGTTAPARPVPAFDPKRAARPPVAPASVADLLAEAEATGTLAAEHPATIAMALRGRGRPEQAAALRRLPPVLARSVHRMLLR